MVRATEVLNPFAAGEVAPGLVARGGSPSSAVYGALAGTVIGMVGTYLAVYVVLLGAVLNAQLAGASDY